MHNFDDIPTASLIARGRQLTAIIADATAELKAIEAALRQRALAMPHEPLSDAHREGRRATLRDAGESLRVTFESDLLKATFDADSALAKALVALLPPTDLDALFRLKRTYERRQKDGHKFRLAAAQTLGPDLAAQVVDLLKDRDKNGIIKSKTNIDWTP